MPILFQNQYYDLENKDDLEKTLNQLVDFYQQSTEEQQERFAQKLLSHYPAEILTSILFSVVKSGHAKGLVALLQISSRCHGDPRDFIIMSTREDLTKITAINLLDYAAFHGHCHLIQILIQEFGYEPLKGLYNFNYATIIAQETSMLTAAKEGKHKDAISLSREFWQLLDWYDSFVQNNPHSEHNYSLKFELNQATFSSLHEYSQRQLKQIFNTLCAVYANQNDNELVTNWFYYNKMLDMDGKERMNSLLHYAVWAGHKEAVCMLLELGCKPNAQDALKRRPLDVAAFANNQDMMHFLITTQGLLKTLTTKPIMEVRVESLDAQEINSELHHEENTKVVKWHYLSPFVNIRGKGQGNYSLESLEAQYHDHALSLYQPLLSVLNTINLPTPIELIIYSYCSINTLEYLAGFPLDKQYIQVLSSLLQAPDYLSLAQRRDLLARGLIKSLRNPELSQHDNLNTFLQIISKGNLNTIIQLVKNLESTFYPDLIYFDAIGTEEDILSNARMQRREHSYHLYSVSNLGCHYINFRDGSCLEIAVKGDLEPIIKRLLNASKHFNTPTTKFYNLLEYRPSTVEQVFQEWGFSINEWLVQAMKEHKKSKHQSRFLALKAALLLICQSLSLGLSITMSADDKSPINTLTTTLQILFAFIVTVDLCNQLTSYKKNSMQLEGNFSNAPILHKLEFLQNRKMQPEYHLTSVLFSLLLISSSLVQLIVASRAITSSTKVVIPILGALLGAVSSGIMLKGLMHVGLYACKTGKKFSTEPAATPQTLASVNRNALYAKLNTVTLKQEGKGPAFKSKF